MSENNLLLIDGFNLLIRGYFATAYGKNEADLSRNSQGLFTNALRVFFQKTLNLISEHRITHLAVAWDVKRNETTRNKKYDFYKATRNELPSPLIEQYETCVQMLDEIGISQVTIEQYEADDVIGTLAKRWSNYELGNCFIYSNDRDLFQLLGENIHQIVAKKGGEILYTLQDFRNDYEICSSQWVDVKALLGDTSDNIPGVAGVGEKSALPLIQVYQSLDGIYENLDTLDARFNRVKKKLLAGKESAYISKELSEIICNITELEDFHYEDLFLNHSKGELENVFRNYELRIRL